MPRISGLSSVRVLALSSLLMLLTSGQVKAGTLTLDFGIDLASPGLAIEIQSQSVRVVVDGVSSQGVVTVPTAQAKLQSLEVDALLSGTLSAGDLGSAFVSGRLQLRRLGGATLDLGFRPDRFRGFGSFAFSQSARCVGPVELCGDPPTLDVREQVNFVVSLTGFNQTGSAFLRVSANALILLPFREVSRRFDPDGQVPEPTRAAMLLVAIAALMVGGFLASRRHPIRGRDASS